MTGVVISFTGNRLRATPCGTSVCRRVDSYSFALHCNQKKAEARRGQQAKRDCTAAADAASSWTRVAVAVARLTPASRVSSRDDGAMSENAPTS